MRIVARPAQQDVVVLAPEQEVVVAVAEQHVDAEVAEDGVAAAPAPHDVVPGADVRAAVAEFVEHYNRCWRLEKLAYRTPLEAREEYQLRQAA